ncbi:olfactory receptor 1E16-like [Pleurodeles waltl]|uniref:olfactory receptor 1E16-like n=1 Tax=Pleurodeles waltl TaxID=8319 RepID=UPI00370945F8
MERRNKSMVSEFILLGLSDRPELQILLFVMFLKMYLVTVLGNSVIIRAISTTPQLHTPMYFFLGNLSFVDMCFTSVTVPKLLVNILSEKKSISVAGCITQLSFFISLAGMECALLTVMAYDRYVAICSPLHYSMVMNRRMCLVLVAISWVTISVHSVLHSVLTSRLTFCGLNLIHHFFCDMTALLKLSCSDTTTNELVIFIEGPFSVAVPLGIVLVSYVRIIATILKMHSAEGRNKAFSTCSSHLIVVALYFGTIIFMYFRPTSSYSLDYDRVVSVMYTVVAPMLNPFIYSLRNSEVKGALASVSCSKQILFCVLPAPLHLLVQKSKLMGFFQNDFIKCS